MGHTNSWRSATGLLATLAIVLSTDAAWAQFSGNAFSGGTTNSGTFGSRTLGQGVGAGSSNFQGSPGNRLEQAQSGAGEVSGGERFVRDSRQPGQFVGADSGDATNFFSQLGGGGFPGGGLEQLARNRNFQNNQTQSGRQAPAAAAADARLRLSWTRRDPAQFGFAEPSDEAAELGIAGSGVDRHGRSNGRAPRAGRHAARSYDGRANRAAGAWRRSGAEPTDGRSADAVRPPGEAVAAAGRGTGAADPAADPGVGPLDRSAAAFRCQPGCPK